jgi:hypothetical protein
MSNVLIEFISFPTVSAALESFLVFTDAWFHGKNTHEKRAIAKYF